MTERRTGRLPQGFARAFAAELNVKMDDAGLTGQRLAALLGRSVGYVSERRNGKAAWTIDDIDVIAEELGTNGMMLLCDIAESSERPRVTSVPTETGVAPGDESSAVRSAKRR